jgi:hypothetical protein
VRAALAGDRLQAGQRLERRVTTGRLVDLDGGLALLRLDRHGDDLLGQAALVRGLHGELV